MSLMGGRDDGTVCVCMGLRGCLLDRRDDGSGKNVHHDPHHDQVEDHEVEARRPVPLRTLHKAVHDHVPVVLRHTPCTVSGRQARARAQAATWMVHTKRVKKAARPLSKLRT